MSPRALSKVNLQDLLIVAEDICNLLEVEAVKRCPVLLPQLDGIVLQTPISAFQRYDLIDLFQKTRNGGVVVDFAAKDDAHFGEFMPLDHQSQPQPQVVLPHLVARGCPEAVLGSSKMPG